jgi:hypothetical protein
MRPVGGEPRRPPGSCGRCRSFVEATRCRHGRASCAPGASCSRSRSRAPAAIASSSSAATRPRPLSPPSLLHAPASRRRRAGSGRGDGPHDDPESSAARVVSTERLPAVTRRNPPLTHACPRARSGCGLAQGPARRRGPGRLPAFCAARASTALDAGGARTQARRRHAGAGMPRAGARRLREAHAAWAPSRQLEGAPIYRFVSPRRAPRGRCRDRVRGRTAAAATVSTACTSTSSRTAYHWRFPESERMATGLVEVALSRRSACAPRACARRRAPPLAAGRGRADRRADRVVTGEDPAIGRLPPDRRPTTSPSGYRDRRPVP